MENEIINQDDQPILVEFEARGMQPVSRDDTLAIERSRKAIETAMATIHNMAEHVVSTVKLIDIGDRPEEVEVEFGLTLEAEAGALIAKAKTQAAFTVKLVWKKEMHKNT